MLRQPPPHSAHHTSCRAICLSMRESPKFRAIDVCSGKLADSISNVLSKLTLCSASLSFQLTPVVRRQLKQPLPPPLSLCQFVEDKNGCAHWFIHSDMYLFSVYYVWVCSRGMFLSRQNTDLAAISCLLYLANPRNALSSYYQVGSPHIPRIHE